MRIIFAGTPVFAAMALETLIKSNYQIVAVLTQPDRPAGRGMKMVASAVKQLALQNELTVLQPASLKVPEMQQQLRVFDADVMVVAAYGLILPESVLEIPRWGCLNIHASLLPRWRGAAPIQRAILAGDPETGITIMQMNAGLDTGDILLQQGIPIDADDTTQSLHDKLGYLGAQSIVEALELLQQGKLVPLPQVETQACYAVKISKSEAAIDWQLSAVEIARKVKAFNPSPGASTGFRDMQLKIWRAQADTGESGKNGEIVAVDREAITVACGKGVLRIRELQKPGGRRLGVTDFLAGNPVQPGECFITADQSALQHG